ncbi:MAG: DUF3596 domain-containing protein, partial [Deltaproteobacteria bacterium]|nr:DUF3596 domain-containing protein [Deltaproteobacteria bacterium]
MKEILDALNKGKKGRVRIMNGALWVDFRYLGRRVRAHTGYSPTPENAGLARRSLDEIMKRIGEGTFEFAGVFPDHPQRFEFARLEKGR